MSTKSNKVRIRGTKVSLEQMSELVDLISLPQNKTVLTMKPHPMKTTEMTKLWETIAKELNVLSGPKKNAEDWRRFFVEWKSRTRKKARDFKVETQATGGGQNSAKSLTEVEEKLMGLLGWVSVHGCQDMPEEQEIHDSDENIENIIVLDIDQNITVDHTYCEKNNLPLDTESEPYEVVESGSTKEETVPPKKKKLNSKHKKNFEKKRRYISSVSVLNDSAKIFADGADKISSAFMHFGNSIFALADAVNAIASKNEMLAKCTNPTNSSI